MRFCSIVIAVTLGSAAAVAQDPPSRVARLNWISGSVSFQPAGVDTWAEASLNYPLTTGDHLFTDSGARAEFHIGPNAVRLDHEANFGFLNLDDRNVQMRFTEGAIEIRLRRLDDGDSYEIDTPNGAVTLLRAGDYRIDTDPGRNATMVTVFSGDAEVSAEGSSFPVHPRQSAYFADGVQPDVRDQNAADDFDHFTASRNTREDQIAAPIHVSDSMVGYEDLNTYGTWSETPDYGWVWAPRVSIGWAPYRVGRWAWVEPWGWTWIDDSPWGFAPFHYGRWASVGAGWVWVPGAVVARPVYAPALVVFAGGGRIGGGAVAWFPLGPREVFRPAYTSSPRYLREVNITHVTNFNVTNVTYVNQRSMTVMQQNAFVSARRVHEASQQVDGSQAQVIGSAPRVAPERQSVLVSQQGGGNVAQPRANVMSRAVVARTPPPAPPVSFDARRQALAGNEGRPLAPQQVNDLRRQAPDAVVNRPAVRLARPVDRPAIVDRPAPVDRFESRPPTANPRRDNPAPLPQQVNPAPVQQPRQPQQPDFRPRPQQEQRVAPPAPRVEAPRPAEVARPEPVRPQVARPEPARPEAPRPEMQRATRPERRPEPEPKPKPVEEKKP